MALNKRSAYNKLCFRDVRLSLPGDDEPRIGLNRVYIHYYTALVRYIPRYIFHYNIMYYPGDVYSANLSPLTNDAYKRENVDKYYSFLRSISAGPTGFRKPWRCIYIYIYVYNMCVFTSGFDRRADRRYATTRTIRANIIYDINFSKKKEENNNNNK